MRNLFSKTLKLREKRHPADSVFSLREGYVSGQYLTREFPK
jgi:hypothetical protein